MDTFQYLTGEIALDHADGLLTRREALRRLGVMGVSGTAAVGLLAACGGSPGDAGDAGAGGPSGVTTGTAAPGATTTAGAGTSAITFPGPSGTLQGAWAPAAPVKGAVLVVHENRGLTDHIRSVAARLAGDGYSALAIDLLSGEGGTASFSDPAQATAALGRIGLGRFVADMKAGLDELARRHPGVKLGAMGFCFGGSMTWNLVGSGDARLAAAVPFYGTVDAPDFSGSRAAVLGIYAGDDDRVNATRDTARAALERARLTHELRNFPGVGHAFFNDTGGRYAAAAAGEAYKAVLDWFGRHL
ncbi:MAG: dienelactone hydrolase family protein [Acidimicrobiales bacterium]